MKKRKVLMVATVPSMIAFFNMDNIKILLNMGFDVHVACNFNDITAWPKTESDVLKKNLREMGILYHNIDFCRNPHNVKQIIRSVKQMDKLLKDEIFSFVHCHTPIAGVVSRLVCHKNRVRVIYTAHGFHFYNGAPFKNWIMYYPIEMFLSKWTDVLITINKEDYLRAKEKFHARRIVYLPGIGIDTEKFGVNYNEKDVRKEFGISKDAVMLLSVGELNKNKNHMAVIKAMKWLPQKVIYVVVGKGAMKDQLNKLKEKYGGSNRIIFTGFRNDVIDFYKASDVFILPSIREGLNVSLMEAMASGLPCLAGRIRGNIDLIDENGGYLFNPISVSDIRNALQKILKEDLLDMGLYNLEKIKKFDIYFVNKRMKKIYIELIRSIL